MKEDLKGHFRQNGEVYKPNHLPFFLKKRPLETSIFQTVVFVI